MSLKSISSRYNLLGCFIQRISRKHNIKEVNKKTEKKKKKANARDRRMKGKHLERKRKKKESN